MSSQAHRAVESDLVAAVRSRFAELPNASRFNDQECEMIYGQGCNFFRQNAYEKAADVFSLLALYRPLEARYVTAHAMCQKLLRRFDIAVQLFATVMILEPGNPKPVMHAAECFFAMGQEETAISVLKSVLVIAGEGSEHAEMRERAEGWLALAERT
ncbi:MAG: putative regulatory protein [Herminiimonas sp.]|nr:putative regulatory protein [Herminiimonas sp.]